MPDPVNLNRFRKKKAREAEARRAAARRALHGLGKAERARLQREQEREARRHAGHRRDDVGPDPDTER